MGRVLLLGAGFSRNWNGWLAGEIMGDLYARLGDDDDSSALLANAPNFEDALSAIQEQYKSNPSVQNKELLDRVQTAILETFRAMNEAFAARPSIEFSNERRFSINDFLARFDAIFTLNQDMLLELHYNIELHEPRRWSGHYFPGMQPPIDWRNAIGAFLNDRLNMIWRPTQEVRVERNCQPIFKLHGSVNWQAGDQSELLVLGADKAGTIEETFILRQYADEFRRYLEMSDTRLMVIGYGFRDDHINDLLYESWCRSGFKMFLVNPDGRGVLNRMTNRGFVVPNPLREIRLIGESMRPLSTTFNGDEIEFGKFQRFFS